MNNNRRNICTEENPCKQNMEDSLHPDMEFIYEKRSLSMYEDDYELWRCPHCGYEEEEIIYDYKDTNEGE